MRAPYPQPSLAPLILNYLKNRTDFYTTLFPRIPLPAHRMAVEQAIGAIDPSPELIHTLDDLPKEMPDDSFMAALGLRDLLKKPAAGRALGRTVISLDETIQIAEFVEDTGLILFRHLADSFPPHAAIFGTAITRHKTALTALLQLHDDLRYHRFSPPIS